MDVEEIDVLHVDDDPSLRDLTTTFLEREDDRFTVTTANSADEGMERINDRPPDCIVSDYNMPGSDGLEFLQAVRAEDPDLPFILYTGKGSESVASDAIAADVTDYVQKGTGGEQYELLANRIRNAVQSRREAERADRQEELMRLTEFAGGTGGFELDRERESILLTAGTRRLIGRPDQSEISLQEAKDLFHPDDREDIQQTIERAFETGDEVHDTWRLRPGNGDERLLDLTITPVVENGEVTKLRGAGHDITDRQERQQELRRNKRVMDEAPFGITISDPSQDDNPLIWVNDQFAELTGYDRDETLGQNCRFLQGEGTREEPVAQLREAIDAQDPVTVELRNYRKDGTEFWNQVSVAPVRNDQGSLVNFVGFQREITDRKQREQALQQSRDLMANMEQLADAGAWEYDAATERLMITDGARRIFGLEPDENRTLEAALDTVHPDDRDQLASRTTDCLETGEPYEIEVRVTTPDDGQRWITARAERVSHGEDGSVVRGYIRDITDQKAYERDLKRYRTVFNELPDPIVVYNEAGQYDLVNDAAAEIRDVPREELIGTTSPYLEQIQEENPDEYESLLDGSQDTLRTDLIDEFPGRGNRTLRCDLTRVTTGTESTGTVIVTRDITERKERRRELEEYETIIEALTDAVYVLDEEGRFTYVSDAFVELVGYDRETILGNTPSLIKDAAAVERAEHELGRLLSSDGPETTAFEVTVEPRDGDPIVCEDHMGVLPYDGDRFNGSVGTLRDITAHRERERQLRRERTRYSTLFETLPNPVLHARMEDGEPVVETVNPAFEDTFGYDAETIRDEPIQDYIRPDQRTDAAQQLNGQVLTGTDGQREVERETTAGVRTFRVNITTRNTESGTHEGYAVYTDITDRKQTERALEQERDLVTGIVETVPVGISVVDAAGSISFVNEQLESITGRSLEELDEMQYDDSRFDLVNERGEALAAGESPYDRVVSQETVVQNQVVGTRRPSGERVWLSVSGAPQYNDDGALERTVFAFEDITEQRALEAELSEILGRISDAFFALDEEYRVTHVNGRGEALLEASEADLLGETLWDIYPAIEESDKIWDRFRAAMETQESVSLEFHSPGGQWFDVRVYPSESGVSVYFRDITEQKNHEQELQELKTQYQTLAENFPDGAVYLIDTDLECVRAGGEALHNVGLSPADVEGRKPQALFPEEIADELSHYYEEALDGTPNTFTQEYGGERYRIQTVPVRTDDAEFDHVMAVSQNITERAADKENLEAQNERLEEFAGIVSHDLRNPLRVAEGNLELAEETCESDHLARAADALDRSQALIDDLLTLAREGQQVAEVEPVAVADVAKSSWQTVETERATREIDVSQDIHADESRFQQLFENLYRNSIEHGGDDVTVSVGAMDDGFYVADTGPGINLSDREAVFEAGYSTNDGGTGFGLRIVAQIADAHGWEITVTDSEQGGARFEITGVAFADR
jgi:PAS domain S-box-containing protein